MLLKLLLIPYQITLTLRKFPILLPVIQPTILPLQPTRPLPTPAPLLQLIKQQLLLLHTQAPSRPTNPPPPQTQSLEDPIQPRHIHLLTHLHHTLLLSLPIKQPPTQPTTVTVLPTIL